MRMCAYSFCLIIDESMPFYGLIGLFRAIGIKEAQGARQRNVRRIRDFRIFEIKEAQQSTVAQHCSGGADFRIFTARMLPAWHPEGCLFKHF